MRFLADENIHAKLLPFLRSVGHDVSESRILLTHDMDFSNTDQYPASSHAGVMLIRINSLHLEKIKASLSNLLAKVPEAEVPGRFWLVFEENFVELKEGEIRLFPA